MKNVLSAIKGEGYKVLFSGEAYGEMDKLLDSKSYSSIFILVDSNTKQQCLPSFLDYFSRLKASPVLVISAGEENKLLETCKEVWEQLSYLGADRKSLLINVGGGVVSDLGGFVAATFKRGIDFVNVPTTLLSMVDASVGGKTGVDLGGLKNQIGIITHPQLVIIDARFLDTLPENEYKSGYAEMLKHGIIQDKDYFEELSQFEIIRFNDIKKYIHHSVEIKNKVVNQDPYESNLRKILNFGHTLGHAIETYFLTQPEKNTLLHGEAIAIGMITESYLGTKLCGLNIDRAKQIKKVFLSIFSKVSFTQDDLKAIMALLKYDKKNTHGKVNFVLLYEIGKPAINIEVPSDLLKEAFHFYQED